MEKNWAASHASAKESGVLVIGQDGQIGSALAPFLREKGFQVFGTTRRKNQVTAQLLFLDLAQPHDDLPWSSVGAVVICAGMTNLAQCEEDPSACEQVNLVGIKRLVDRSFQAGCQVIYLSSNAIFDGTKAFCSPTEIPHPRTNYGKSILAMETELLQRKEGLATILRLTKVISGRTPFIVKWEEAAKENKEIVAHSDRVLSPISLESVLDSIFLLLEKKASGVFQLGGTEEISYFDYALRLFSDDPTQRSLVQASQDPQSRGPLQHNSLTTFLPTRESQYGDLLHSARSKMGLMSSYAYLNDPKRLAFTLSRYKFAAKMLSGLGKVLEVGCADAFASPVVLQEVQQLTACDFDRMFIDGAKKNHPYADKITFLVHDLVQSPMKEEFDGAFCLDVLEHIKQNDEGRFLGNMTASLREDGVCVIGMPSLESQQYASALSKEGHVNCKSGEELKSLLNRHFRRVFLFSMNDEVVHTGFSPMAHYLLALCCFPRKGGIPGSPS